MLRASNILKRLGGADVLRHVDVTCEAAEVVVIAGENGAGKSTLLRVLSGILEPDRGEVSVCGFSLRREPLAAKARLGYAPDGLEPLPDLLVSEFLALVRALKPTRGSALASGASAHIAPLDASLDVALGIAALGAQRLGSLSFGQRKRVTIRAALIGAPDLLLLDEPTNGLDATGLRALESLIADRRQRALATVLTSNDSVFMTAVGGRPLHLVGRRLQPA